MKFWQSVSFADPDELVAIAVGAEDAGFEGVLLSEHLFVPEEYAARYPYSESGRPDFDAATPFPDPWVAITAMAAATNRLRFATMVHILPLHHPLEVAKAVGTAAFFSQHRIVLGAGAGWMREEFDALGVDFDTRGARFDESMDVLRLLLTGGMVEYHGDFFDFDRLQMSPTAGRPIPIYIGGSSPRALRRAATRGDGWLGAGNTPDEAERILRELGRLRAEAGRTAAPFETVVPLVVPPTREVLEPLAACGMHGAVSYPFRYTLAPDASLAQKIDAMRRYSDEVIGPLRDL